MTTGDPTDENPADSNTVRRIRRVIQAARRRGLASMASEISAELRHRGRLAPRVRRVAEVGVKVGIPALAHAAVAPLLARRRDVYVFYDLAVSPVTFDVCWAIVIGETLRRERGLDGVRLVVVPGRAEGFRREDPAYETTVDLAERRRRIDAVIVPAAQLLPSLREVRVCRGRGEALWLRTARAAHAYPELYWPGIPEAHRPGELLDRARAGRTVPLPFRPPAGADARARSFLDPIARGRRVVTVTLRQYDYNPSRNSDIAEWAAFAGSLDQRQWCLVVVPDTARADAPPEPALERFAHCAEAARDLPFRAALYRRAYLNLMVNNGPHGICMFDENCAYLMFKILTPSAPQTTEQFMRELGFTIGEDPPFARPWQRWIWQDDRRDIIRGEFDRMCAVLSKRDDGGRVPAQA